MATNLTDLFKNSFGETLVRECSGLLGESAQGISSSMDAIVPSLLRAMIGKANTDQGARSLLDYITTNGLNDTNFNPVSTDELMAKGSGVLNYLVGNQLTSLIDAVSSAGGLKTSSASALLKIVAPLLMGFFGRIVKERSLSHSEAKNLLLDQPQFIKSDISQGIGEEMITTGNTGTSTSSDSNTGMLSSNPPTGMSKLLPWIILMLTSLGIFYFLEKGCSDQIPMDKMPPTETRDTI
ncbi:MAG TPA: DUF937 domain-containing protein [Saprospiraceae bacterium]|nr:DUF937 domain-containing protein [Saprospiraceae bacterium]